MFSWAIHPNSGRRLVQVTVCRTELDSCVFQAQTCCVSLCQKILLTFCVACLGCSGSQTSESYYGMGHRSRDSAEVLNGYAPFMALGFPSYSVRVAPVQEDSYDRVAHGLSWNLALLVRPGEWRHGVGLRFTQFLRPASFEWGGSYRARLVSFPSEEPVAHILLGAGGSFETALGWGTTTESVLLFGKLGRANLAITFAHQYWPDSNENTLSFMLGASVPYVFR